MANNMKAGIQELEEPVRELPSALADLQSVLSTIEVDQSELKSRLYPVLDPEDMAGQFGCDGDGASSIEPRLTDIVRRITQRLHAIREQQRGIINRLHV